ncbi:uncharacterized protein LOC117307476 [Asterias rubens]|uniref:uncharacterized protein LOC117307476 n=1 Tax=Asterias rubens TaxID=7604 RepID=UPI0014553CF8|nr:uncharacterized protein LOC117307476 [Asterias rubens]
MASNIEPVQSVRCPACFAKDPVVRKLDPLDTQDLSITSSGKTILFKDATKIYLQDHYPNLSCTTYRVPAALFYNDDGNLDLATDEELFSNPNLFGKVKKTTPAKEVARRFQKDAVEKVVKCFHAWGCEHGGGMMVLSEYDMGRYLKAVKTGSKKWETIDGEHDVMVINLNHGVTFVQVKSVKTTSTDKTMWRQTQSAFKQVTKDEKAFREMNADLDFISTVPVVGFVALPNLTRDHLSKMVMCDAHKRQVLTSEDLESPTEFNESVGKRLQAGENLGLENYKELCGRYVGLASIVKIRTLPDAIKLTSAKVGKIRLTPEQNEIIKVGNRKQVIFGDYGTGKSLVLAKMAEKIAKSEEGRGIIYVVSCTSINLSSRFDEETTHAGCGLLCSPSLLVSQYRKFFSEPMSPSIKIMSLADLYCDCFPITIYNYPTSNRNPFYQSFEPKLLAELTRRVMSKHPNAHIMWDEVPFTLGGLDWSHLESKTKSCIKNFVWVSIATESYAEFFLSTNSKNLVLSRLPPSFQVACLTSCKRMARNNFRLYTALKPPCKNKFFLSTSGNAVDGGVPQWYPVHNCFCGTTDPLKCTCIQTRFTHTLKHMWERLPEIDPSSVSFVLGDYGVKTNRFLMDVVSKACKTLEIPSTCPSPVSPVRPVSPVSPEGKTLLVWRDLDPRPLMQETSEVVASGSKCRIVDIVSYRGCESPVVIMVIVRKLPHGWRERRMMIYAQSSLCSMISRALGQIFIITLPHYLLFPPPRESLSYTNNNNKKNNKTFVKHDNNDEDRCYPDLEDLVEKKYLVKCPLQKLHADTPPTNAS